MSKSWEEMVQEVVIDGRPGDVRSAALGWQELLRHLRDVKQSLETNVKDLGETWKGKGYDAFKAHIDGLAKNVGYIVEDAETGSGIVTSLNTAASDLAQAQAAMPIPLASADDIAAARDGRLTLGIGTFEMKVKPDFLSWGPLDWGPKLHDWLFDQTAEARKVYEQVDDQYQGRAADMPGQTGGYQQVHGERTTPDLSGAGASGAAGAGGFGGGAGAGAGGLPGTKGFNPSDIGSGGVGGTGSGTHPSTGGGGTYPSTGGGDHPGTGGYPGTGTSGAGPGAGSGYDPGDYGSGLAGAGGGGAGLGTGGAGLGGGGLGSAGLGGGGLGSTAGLGGGAGAGAGGGGAIPGGGALGKGVGTGLAPGMMGAGAGAGGRGQGTGAGTKGGAAGALRAGGGGAAAGGMAPGARGGHGFGEDQADRNSWLQEDEDVWGAGGDLPPGVLR
ncbi:WXG100 family type VII secretion target [Actinoplanes teichomyceticus]|uniref:WXG100 family type VII secretion target n=1 Tax=Actinoplanes teichomyceticus TaxID=1867 RepID=A0A561WBA9_ACTTI|nr:hypothetical protein [Actinoplanes teichomyceticus]TWG21125.1 hypothetical protein FHX34_103655 [Actinoplanes teichomyceticus]GIF14946.1 hypothetical protein Ate01nite_49780 [Actinoplanes teichomyceticus]